MKYQNKKNLSILEQYAKSKEKMKKYDINAQYPNLTKY